ncbi:MAG: hypothetical protein JSS50_00975 [Proteobacteria bacterium]|nr:hypothetical protein [Pseudomonadota bacterium]
MLSSTEFQDNLRSKFKLSRNGLLSGFEYGVMFNTVALFVLPTFASNLCSIGAIRTWNALHTVTIATAIFLTLFSIANFALSTSLKENWSMEATDSVEYKTHIIDNKRRKYIMPLIFASCVASLPFMIGGYGAITDFWLSRPYIDSPAITAAGSIVIGVVVIFDIAQAVFYFKPEATPQL